MDYKLGNYKPILNFSLIAILVLVSYYFFSMSLAYWAVIAALSLQLSLIQIIRKKCIKLCAIALGTASLIFVINALPHYFISTAILLSVIIFSTTYVCLRYPGNWGAGCVINFFAILSSCSSVNFLENGERVFCILIGFFIVIFLYTFFYKSIDRVKSKLELCLLSLGYLNQSIFNCYLAQDYIEKKYLYDREQHYARSDYLVEMNELRETAKDLTQAQQNIFAPIIMKIDYLYENILALGLPLYRVEDHTVFAVENKELHALSAAIDTRLHDVIKNIFHKKNAVVSENTLIENINLLEEVYNSAIQVVSQDPKVFLIFIHDLYALDEAILEILQKFPLTRVNIL
ncbi:MAG: hypothetical protein P4M12_03375 [Gammaproteobacteria bacterium]|nr:hypothetical protein [Gammaproteobacteria bacterium]